MAVAAKATVMGMRVFTCGGTIDKVYFDAASTYEVGASPLRAMLTCAGGGEDIVISEIIRKDSLDMTATDRETVVAAVADCDEDRVLVTHGTDTMVKTARALQAVRGKRIVLTGAMQPAVLHETDAVFNVGFALGVLRAGPVGDGVVLIAMHGQTFAPDSVRKNRYAGRFEAEV